MKKNFIILATCGILCCTANAQTKNTPLGTSALSANTTGDKNTAIGYNSMIGNTTGFWNTAVGGFSLRTQTNTAANTAIGYKSQEQVTGGGGNTSLGYRSLQVLQGGGENVALGTGSMEYATGGYSNTAVGYQSIERGSGKQNTGIGCFALSSLTTGYDNVALGYEAGSGYNTGIRNINIGTDAGGSNNTSYNIILGYRTGATTGNNNIIIGKKITLPAGTSNAMNIGGVLFGSGFQSALPTSATASPANGKIGINVVSPTATLDVAGDAKISSNLTVSGNVGIGTTTPSEKLDVAGNVNAQSFTMPFNGGKIGSSLSDQTTYDGKTLSHYSLGWFSDSWNTGGPTLWQSAYGGMKFFTSGMPRLNIDKNGNVGIGTTTPQAKLEVDAEGDPTNIEDNPNNGIMIRGTDQVLYMGAKSSSHVSYIQSVDYGTATAPLLLNARGGNVGIGTTTPAYTLDVLGTIRAKEIYVNMDGTADFVFKDNYKLKPIQEVYEFAKENKHLPEIPSEAEVVKNGMNMGEFQVKLLQKVEELTLYMAQQNQMIQDQQAKIKELETLINK